MKRTVMAVLLALMLVLAGCSGGVQTEGNATAGDGSTTGDSETTATGSDGGSGGQTESTGTVTFYVSDEQNAIGDFEHLNVTITKVGFERAGDGSEKTDGGDAENETTPTVTPSASAEGDASATADGDQAESNETADGGEAAEGDNDGNEKKGGWTEFDVDSQTVDLTQLQGANATSIGSLSVEEGTYSKVFIYVSDVEGTLKTGETVNVKLPSNKLQLKKGFSVGAGGSVDFVYDVTVFKAGQSGKYILKPVVSESGTGEEVEIRDVDEKKGNGAEKSKTGDESQKSALDASFVGTVTAGENATVRATQNGTAVADATVTVNGETVGTTDENGDLTFAVPEGEKTLEVTVTLGDAEAELSQRLATSTGAESGNDKSDGTGNRAFVAPTP